MRQLGPLMRSDDVNSLFTRKLDADKPIDYDDFLNELSKLLVSSHFQTPSTPSWRRHIWWGKNDDAAIEASSSSSHSVLKE